MVRLFGNNLKETDRMLFALTGVYGVGFTRARFILDTLKIDRQLRVSALKEADVKRILDLVEKEFKVEGDLRSEISDNIKRLKEIGSYRGIRHIRGLPARGQRTRSNARTRRGRKHTIGALSKEAWAKVDVSAQQNKSK
jgi:small subunit ribosomal protein S13